LKRKSHIRLKVENLIKLGSQIAEYYYFKLYNILWTAIYFIVFAIILFYLGRYTKCDLEHYLEINKNLIRFSSLFNAILIAFISSKIFDIRNEKKHRQVKIDILSNKLTNGRRICEILASNRFFSDGDKLRYLRRHYDKLEIWHLWMYSDDPKEEPSQKIQDLRTKYYDDNKVGGLESQLYLFFNSFIRYFKSDIRYLGGSGILHDENDHNVRYPLGLIERLSDYPSVDNLYTVFDKEWAGGMKNVFNFNNLTQEQKTKIEKLASRINKRTLSNKKCDNWLISEMSGELSSNVIPELYELMRLNHEAFPSILKNFLRLLIALLIFGVFIPLIISTYDFKLNTIVGFTNFSMAHVLVILLIFITQISYWLKKEIDIYE